MRTSDFEAAVAQVSAELAAGVLRLALMDMEAKYDPGQPRAPKGVSNGGQWVGGTGGGEPRPSKPAGSTVRRLPVRAGQAARLLMTDPEVALGARAVGLPALGGGIAMTRALGDFDHRTTGREKTPFLNLPAGKLDLRVTSDMRPKASGERRQRQYSPVEEARIEEECDELERNDRIRCRTYAAMYGRSTAARKRIAHICLATVAERVAECRTNGGVSGVNTPLFMGNH